MSKKRILLLMLIVVMSFSLVLTGCGDTNNENNSNNTENNQNNQNTENSDENNNQESENNNNTINEEQDNETNNEINNTENTADEVELTDGYYYEDTTGLTSFYRFNEDGTYYAKFFDGGVVDAGTYEVLDEETEYSTGPGEDEDYKTVEDNPKDTAPQAIAVTSYTSGQTMKMAYEDDELKGVSLGGMSYGKTLVHKPDYQYNASVDEIPIIIHEFYANNSLGQMLTLNHDKSFGDTTGDVYLSGNWEKVSNNEFKLNYTTQDGNGKLVVSENGETAELTLPDGNILALTSEIATDTDNLQVLTLEAKDVQVGLPMGVDLRLDGYKDGTCELYVLVEAVGAELLADSGTFTFDETYTFEFNFETAGDLVAVTNYESATEEGLDLSLEYAADTVVTFNESETPLSIDSKLEGSYVVPKASEPELMGSLTKEEAQVGLPMPVELRLDVYDDETCELYVIVEQVGAELLADKGTYSYDQAYNFNFVFENANEVSGTPDYDTATETSLEYTAVYKADTSVEFSGTETPLSIDTELVGVLTIK